MPDERTPPTGTRFDAPLEPPRPLPTLASIYNLVAGVAGQIGGLRADVDTLLERTAPPPVVVDVTPEGDAPPSPSVAPTLRPSRLAQAGSAAGWAGKVIVGGTGALTLISTVISLADDPQYAPALQALRVLGRWLLKLGGVQLP